MITNFEQTYNENPQNPKPEVLNEGSYCAAYFDQNWYRVKVFEVNENDVNCFFIDYGDVQLIRKSDIYQLRREFAKEKAQVGPFPINLIFLLLKIIFRPLFAG